MRISKVISRSLLTLGVAGLGLASAPRTVSADVLNDFTINPKTLAVNPAAFGSAVIGDKLVGGYNEVFTVTGATTFATTAYWTLPVLWSTDGTVGVSAGTSGIGDSQGYNLYAVFNATGNITPVSGGFDFTASGGSVTLYADPLRNTTFALPSFAPGAVTLGLTADETALANSGVLASAALASGNGHTNAAGQANGDFGLTFKPFTLTGLGSAYFVSPQPFYLTAFLKGQFNSFPVFPAGCGTTVAFGSAGCSSTINGSADAFFAPEPATLGLLGMGLFATGLVARRRRAKA